MSATTHGGMTGVPAPSVLVQILRAVAGTVSVLLMIALTIGLVAGVATNAYRIQLAWFHVAGDPSISLADGVVLSDQEADVAVPQAVRSSWPTTEDVARIAAVTGAPVRRLTADQGRDLTGVYAPNPGDTVELRLYSTPLGVVRVYDPGVSEADNPDLPPEITLRPYTARPWVGGTSEQLALLRRVVEGWGAGASPEVPGTHVVVEEQVFPGGERGFLDARLATSGAITGYGSLGNAYFSGSGRLLLLRVNLLRVASTPTIRVVSPASAFDRVRHHDDGTVAEPQVVTGARLVVGDYSGGDSERLANWMFVDAQGSELDGAAALR
jgi:hypothetical protein